ncbi:Y-family DNA polymerase [Pseudomonadota bacterium]|jgi:DNA polymerase V|nr:Y-family DNA polymerase [Pseudomonadota bacterium]|tara:strand:+ start:4297 stop:5568 length:1272 start_codon:yes stop_codon:yes gene_type:complete
MNLLALVDCDNFYASCERLFRPDLRKKPIVVLSNNDGCVIARSKEAKAMGIKMGVPWFQIKKAYLANGGQVFSSNFALYGDLSNRVMHVLEGMVNNIEVYSIDEAFLDLRHIQNSNHAYEFGIHCRNIVDQWVGIPVRIGIGPTKTLAKIASHVAKKKIGGTGVFCLHESLQIEHVLKHLPINEIWGIGRNLSRRLNDLSVYSSYELMKMDTRLIRSKFSVVLERTVRELRGEQCLAVQNDREPKKQIIVSRSFRERTGDFDQLKPLISNFAVRAGEKLRHEGQKCSQVSVLIATSPFSKQAQYRGFHSIQFSNPVNDTRSILAGANQALQDCFRQGYAYAKAGVLLSQFSHSSVIQRSLFDDLHKSFYQKQNEDLMRCIDSMNAEGVQVYYASQCPGQVLPMNKKMMSPKYTTSWLELPTAK